jgi:DNA-binding NarL/FixJ family response regulator
VQNTETALSEIEAQTLLSLPAGKTNSQIGADIATEEIAVKEHIKAMLRKVKSLKARSG